MRIAALDLGSNSFHLVVADAGSDGSLQTVLREKEMLRLGDVVTREGRLDDDAADRAVASARRLHTLATTAGAERIVACATSALREAANGREVIERIDREANLQVELITGDEEARLIFEAVRASVLMEEVPVLCLDLGGGSLEVMVGDGDGLLWATSVPLGVARLTAELVHSDPPDNADLKRLRRRLESVLAPLAEEVDDFDARTMVGTSGTLCALARAAAAERTGTVPDSVNQLRVRRKDVAALHRELVRLPSAERQRLPGVDSRRADQLPAGSLLVLIALELFGLEDLTVGEWALREGMLLDAIGRPEVPGRANDPRMLRRESVEALLRRCHSNERHAAHVAKLAVELFDRTQALHELSAVDRELLEYGALLHDIGEHVAAKGHDKHGAYLVQHGQLRGFDPDEVAVLASLARFHLRGTPKPFFEPFRTLRPAQRERTVRMIALLRLADGLDRSKSGAVTGIGVEISRRHIRLSLEAAGGAEPELWAVDRKGELFERVFERELEVTTAPAGVDQPLVRGA